MVVLTGSSLTGAKQSLAEHYGRQVENGCLESDLGQKEAVHHLNELAQNLVEERKGHFLHKILGRSVSRQEGLYIWGDVGRGKTMLMDMFFEHVDIVGKRRVHFHEFMDEVHQKITEIRRENPSAEARNDPVGELVKPIIRDVRLLCFDEFHVTDITNAMLLGRLFEKLFAGGVVVVATSNVAPDDLYHNGLNRDLFLPFIELLKSHCKVLHLVGDDDYRLKMLTSHPVFHFGPRAQTAPKIESDWQALSGGLGRDDVRVRVLGRDIQVPEAALGCARFSYEDLCEAPLGSRDYLAIADAFHTLVIEGVPRFHRENSNGAKRFIQLIDTLYDRGIKLVASFEKEFDQLGDDRDTAFEFRRTISRLNEMSGKEYLSRTVHRSQ